jgi:hypothetical protein
MIHSSLPATPSPGIHPAARALRGRQVSQYRMAVDVSASPSDSTVLHFQDSMIGRLRHRFELPR